MNFKTFTKRLTAYVIDMALVYLVTLATVIFCVATYGYLKYSNDPILLKELATSKSVRIFSQTSHLVLALAYFSLSQWYFGKTAGKKIMQLEVVTLDGAELDLSRSCFRALAAGVCAYATLGISYAVILFRKDAKSLHDLLTGTKVKSTRPPIDRHETNLPKVA